MSDCTPKSPRAHLATDGCSWGAQTHLRALGWILAALTGGLVAPSCSSGNSADEVGRVVNVGTDRIVGEFTAHPVDSVPTSTNWSTQGLVADGATLFHSSGGYGDSAVRSLDARTGQIQHERLLSDDLFGEGLVLVDDELLQLTWREGRLLVWSLPELDAAREVSYEGEGWGICLSNRRLVVSDGTEWLTFRDPVDFTFISNVRVVRSNGEAQRGLNDLACVNGQVIANVASLDELVVIDEATGLVEGLIGTASLRPSGVPDDDDHMLNGVAFEPSSGRLYLTGKRWPVLFEVELRERSG